MRSIADSTKEAATSRDTISEAPVIVILPVEYTQTATPPTLTRTAGCIIGSYVAP